MLYKHLFEADQNDPLPPPCSLDSTRPLIRRTLGGGGKESLRCLDVRRPRRHRPLQAEAVSIPLCHNNDAPPPPHGRSVRPPPDNSYQPETRGRGGKMSNPLPPPLAAENAHPPSPTRASPDGGDREGPDLPVRQTPAPIGAPADRRRRRPIIRRRPTGAPSRVPGRVLDLVYD